jgi:hypothetical protein
MNQYAHSLRPDILVECNPNGVGEVIVPPVDHGRLLEGGDAYWVESGRVGLRDGRLVSRIRNYKVGRALHNMTFDYTLTPLEMAESMAFNQDCLGCITWFEYGRLVAMPGSTNPVSPELGPFIRFFQKRRDLLEDSKVVSDLAVIRSFPSQVFGGAELARLNADLENLLITNRCCFQILYDTQLRRLQLGRFPVLALAGCAALSGEEVEALRRHVAAGGKLFVIGPLGSHDQWMRPRPAPALSNLPPEKVVSAAKHKDWLEAISKACGQRSLTVQAQPSLGLCAEVTEQANRRLVHLVNYRQNEPIGGAAVTLRLPAGRQATAVYLASPERETDQALEFTVKDGAVQFQVPRIGIYEVAVAEMQPVR